MTHVTERIQELAKQADQEVAAQIIEFDPVMNHVPSRSELVAHAQEWSIQQGHDEELASQFAEYFANHNEGQRWRAVAPKPRLRREFINTLATEHEIHSAKTRHPATRNIGKGF